MHRHALSSSAFGIRLLGVALCAASVALACSNSDSPKTTAAGGSGNASSVAGSAGSAGTPSSAAGGTTGNAGTTAVGSGGSGSGGITGVGGGSGGGGGTPNGGSPSGGGSGGSVASSGGTAGAGGATAHTGPWKIMPLGDSTTAAVCYRAKLWGKLQAAGKTNIDFVGTEKSVSCTDNVPANFDQDNEGHSCYIVSNIIDMGSKPSCTGSDFASDSTDLARWFDSQMPDIVLMHFGTNDVWNGYGPTQILAAYKAIFDKIRTRNANVKLFVAQIIPLKPDTSKDYDALVKALNSAIPQWATDNSTAASPITVVDQFTGYDIATDNQADGVHPNPTGSDKIAQKWFDAIQGLL
jgi:hypothetical protein